MIPIGLLFLYVFPTLIGIMIMIVNKIRYNKWLVNTLTILLFIYTIIYLMTAFTTNSLNPFLWSEVVRGFNSVLYASITFVTVMLRITN